MNLPLVSIIIPTYNRAHLISETLNSISTQTYANWECIIVDDDSTDNTAALVQTYTAKDSRFKYYMRPENMPKGANSCRNYGFEKSKGEYINWFDSDDLMVPSFLKYKVDFIGSKRCDFIYSNTINFDTKKQETPMFRQSKGDAEVTPENFIKQIVAWSTPDFLCTRKSIGEVRFNESLRSGQEYNFFSKYLLDNVKGFHLDEVLTKRRIHEDSIQSIQHRENRIYLLNKYNAYFRTYQDVREKANKESVNYLLNLAMSKAFELSLLKKKIPNYTLLFNSVVSNKGFLRALIFLLSLLLALVFGAGHRLMNFSRS